MAGGSGQPGQNRLLVDENLIELLLVAQQAIQLGFLPRLSVLHTSAKAAGLDPACFEAHVNLGNIQHDLGRYHEALASYRAAVALNPSYPDAHFYLAVTLEKNGQSQDARPHWKAYQQLAPTGEWSQGFAGVTYEGNYGWVDSGWLAAGEPGVAG